MVRKVLPEKTYGLIFKTQMGSLTPFRTTLYLDSDTVVLGNLDYAFARAEEFGVACCICECPWLRRYDATEQDGIEYNTGVLFFSEKSAAIFAEWEKIAPGFPARSRVLVGSPVPIESPFDDQASFARAVRNLWIQSVCLALELQLPSRLSTGSFYATEGLARLSRYSPGSAEAQRRLRQRPTIGDLLSKNFSG